MWRGVSTLLLPPNGRGVQVTLPDDSGQEAGCTKQQEGGEGQVDHSEVSGQATDQGRSENPVSTTRGTVTDETAVGGTAAVGAAVAGTSSTATPGPCLIRKEPEVGQDT